MVRIRTSSGESAGKNALLLTGVPGVGKTTVIRRVASSLPARQVRGFLTEETRVRGRRVGFKIATFEGEERTLAHVDLLSPYRVGRYRVDLKALDRVVEKALSMDPEVRVYLVDEIGKMECFSTRFVEALSRLLDSNRCVVATVARKGSGFIASVKRRPDVELWEVTQENREALPGRVLAWLGEGAG